LCPVTVRKIPSFTNWTILRHAVGVAVCGVLKRCRDIQSLLPGRLLP
jgi:hypothetical protein